MSRRLDPSTLPLWGSRLIEASAGTGKTWTIAALYLRLVLGHGDDDTAFAGPLTPPQILVMTFTVAATRELSDRIRKRLVEAAECFRGLREIDADDRLLVSLLADYPEGGAREQAAWRLAMAAEGMDDGAVFTIDAWVQRMLREHAFDSGCLFDEEVQADDAAMLGEAARDYWRQQVYPLDRDAFDGVIEVWSDVDALVADAVRLVGFVEPGTEDERTLGEVWDVASAARGEALAVLKDGWTERVRTLRAWIHEGLEAKVKVFNGNKLQRRHVDGWLATLERWSESPNVVELDLSPSAIHRLSSTGLREASKDATRTDVPDIFDGLPRVMAGLRDLVPPSHAMRRHAAVRIVARMLALKRRAGTYGFQDMLERLDRALAGASGGRLRARIVAQYPVALIDEFQDTSSLQYRIFDRLYRAADNDRSTALLLIGDPKQSIYGFRGADIRSYLRARVAIGDRQYFLGTNYRSTKPLVDGINALFGQAEALRDGAFRFGGPAQAGALPFVPVDARGRRETYVRAGAPQPALTLCHDAELSTKKDAQRRFAEACAEHVVTMLDDSSCGFDDPVDGFTRLAPADITVLVRDRYEAAAIRRALRRRRVASVYLSDQDSVFASDEAGDLLHWLRAVADPQNVRRARVAYATALVGLPLADIARLAHDDTAFEQRLEDLKVLNGVWRRQGVLPMLRRTLHRLDLPARWLREPDGERRLTNVLHLAELLQAASAKLDGEQAVIRWLVAQLDQQARGDDAQVVRLESDAALVRVVTIHNAKGLEYPVVYVPFVTSYRDPQWFADSVAAMPDDDGVRTIVFDVGEELRARLDRASRQEDLRLLYVALTRARHALWIGVAALKSGHACAFDRSAFGYLASDDEPVPEQQIETRLRAVFGELPSVAIVAVDGDAAVTRLLPAASPPPLRDAPDYDAPFERDWTIGSFSAFVRDIARVPIAAVMVDPAVEEELLSGPAEEEATTRSTAARHRFPRGALPGNFLHEQLEWLAGQRFALTDGAVRDQLGRRCERQGWGHRSSDVTTWMTEVVTSPLPPIGTPLHRLERIVPEMEFWFPSTGLAADTIDRLCRRHLLDGRDRPALPARTLSGMLMGFADLVFEIDGRYWVLDYKSNALGSGDDDYTHDALEGAMAQHRYDVQGAIYLLALHRLLRQRLGDGYDPERHLGGALYLFLRGIQGPSAGCYVIEARADWLAELDAAFGTDLEATR